MKKVFTLIIACIAAIAATAQTEGATATWGLTGEGTEANPYCIYTATFTPWQKTVTPTTKAQASILF